jgi:hypothetical protein
MVVGEKGKGSDVRVGEKGEKRDSRGTVGE